MKRNLFKVFMLFSLAFLVILGVVGCKNKNNETKQPTEPGEKTSQEVTKEYKFQGVDDITIERGSKFAPLNGVSIVDNEGKAVDFEIFVDTRGFNANVIGDYTVTYTAYDDNGTEIKAVRKVSVVFTDAVAPEIYGASDTSIVVGDTSFTTAKDVSAVDNIDGNITSSITIEGEVDVWKLGEYTVKYSVLDSANNKKEITRKVTVGIGNFEFVEFSDYESSITGGKINTVLGDFSLIQLNLKLTASAEGDYEIKLPGATGQSKVNLKSGNNDVTLFFRFKAPLDNASLELPSGVTLVSAKYAFAGVNDKEAPVITITNSEVCIPVGSTLEFAKGEILRGATAEDNLDGNLTSKLDVDLKETDLNTAGTYDIAIFVSDTMENKGEVAVSLVVAKVHDTFMITDPEFNEETNSQFKLSSGAGGQVTAKIENGEYVIEIVTPGGWASGDSPYLSGITTDVLKAGYYYMAEFDAKALKPRAMNIRAGMELWTDPWMENFRDTTKYQLTEEYQTYRFIFFVASNQSRDGSKVIKFEIQLGSIDWSGNESDNTVYIDNFQFYLLSNESNAPVINTVSGIKTTFAKGEEMPDFTKYFTITDVEDGPIEVTSEMIDVSSLDMNTPGKYTVKITVTDTDEEVTEATLKITILESADTVGPVVTIPQAALALIQASMPVKEGTDLTSVFTQVLENTTIKDNIDGDITPTMDMVDFDGLTINSVKVGEYNVSISCKDSSGNESNVVTITITVIDGSAPLLIGVADFTVYVGQQLDPTKGVVAYDTNDGIIHLTTSNLSGFNAFMDTNGNVTGTPGDYQVSYSVKDEAGNEATLTAVITVIAEALEFNSYAAQDLLALEQTVGGGGKVSIKYEDGIGIITYEGASLYWASAAQLKYTGNVKLEANKTFKLLIEAKAELPREILIYFVDAEGNKIPGFVNENKGNKYCLGLTDEYFVYEIVFTPTSSTSSASTLEFDMEWESFLANAGQANTIYFKQIKILPEGENQAPPEDPRQTLLVMDFQDLKTQTDFHDDKWAVEKLENDSWVPVTGTTMRVRDKNGSIVVNMHSGADINYRFTFNQGQTIGRVDYFSIDLGNYFSGATTANIKIGLLGSDNSLVYLYGDADNFYELPVGAALDKYEKEFDEIEVKGFFIEFKSSLQDAYIYMDNVTFKGPKGQAALDVVAPVITVDNTVANYIANTKFNEGESLTEQLTQLKQAVTITDDVDGTIALTDEMINLGGLNPVNPVAGTYTLTITAQDTAGNVATSSITVKVKSAEVSNANLLIDFEEYKDNAAFWSDDWRVYRYVSSWTRDTSEQMRSRGKNDRRVVNMASAGGISMKYIYNEDGLSLGKANYFSIDLGNYYDPKQPYSVKVVLVDSDGNNIYVLGSAEEFYAFPVTDALNKYELSFNETAIDSFYIVFKAEASSYLYMDNITLQLK